MPAILAVGAMITCPHGAPMNLVPSQTRVLVNNVPAFTIADKGPIAGCPFMIPVGPAMKPQPCMVNTWMMGSLRVLIGGKPALLQSSVGLCSSAEQIPAGPPIIGPAPPRVEAL